MKPKAQPKADGRRRNKLADFDHAGEILGFAPWWGWQRQLAAVSTEMDRTSVYLRDEVVFEVPRQSGKSMWFRGRGLVGLGNGESVSITAQRTSVSEATWIHVLDAITEHDPGIIVKTSKKPGQQIATLRHKSGHVHIWRVIADIPTGARGPTINTILVDEAAYVNQAWLPVVRGTGITVDGRQVVQGCTAGDETSTTWDADLTSALADPRGSCAFMWGADREDDWCDEATWFRALPTLGWRNGVALRPLRRDSQPGKMGEVQFRREYLGISSAQRLPLFDAERWQASLTSEPDTAGGWCYLGVDTAPDSSHSSIVGVWATPDSNTATAMLLATGGGDDWLEREVAAACSRHWAQTVSVDTRSPAAHIIQPLRGQGWDVKGLYTNRVAAAAVGLRNAVERGELRVEMHPAMNLAAETAVTRPLPEGWAIDRRRDESGRVSGHPITPVVALAMALDAAKGEPAGIYVRAEEG